MKVYLNTVSVRQSFCYNPLKLKLHRKTYQTSDVIWLPLVKTELYYTAKFRSSTGFNAKQKLSSDSFVLLWLHIQIQTNVSTFLRS